MRPILNNMICFEDSPLDLQTRFTETKALLESKILGQQALVDRLFIALLADGHLLVEGPPGLAKTRAVNTLSEMIDADFQRIQFTPDLLPADLTGTEIFRPQTGEFSFQQGPLFHNLILADEINRAPAKVQSALLEAMAERQITVAGSTHSLPDLFMVMATQNPLEQEGTYALPEAQLDRFLMHVEVSYPDAATETEILRLVRQEHLTSASDNEAIAAIPKLTLSDIQEARQALLNCYISEPVEAYLVQITMTTRQAQAYDETLAAWIEYGASPRATLALDRCARAHAWLAGRDFVTPEDVQAIAHDVLRHRIIVNYAAEAEGIRSNDVIARILQVVPVP